MGRFDGKVVFITGAARGQGREHAVRFASEGADLILLDVCKALPTTGYPPATKEMLAETAGLVREQGGRAVEVEADVRSQESLDAALRAGLDEFGRLDVVLANAGIFTASPACELSEDQWTEMIDINLTGVWRTAKATVPTLIEQGEGGAIVMTSSSAGLKAYTHCAHYSAAKHGVVGLMRTLALEVAPHFIRVNAVCPTTVDTPMALEDLGLRKRFRPDLENPTVEDMIPPSKDMHLFPIPWLEKADVTNAVTWLASEEARYMTGVALPIDAGTLIK